MSDEICRIPGCDRPRDKKQNRTICQMHRVRYGRHKSYDLPTAPKLPEGILKICKKHGELTASQVYQRIKGKVWLSCRKCVKESYGKFKNKVSGSYWNDHKKFIYIKGTGLKVSKELYFQILESQNHLCAICKRPESIVNSTLTMTPKRLAIDHDHKTGKLRGLLCHKCNVSIGSMDDSIETLEEAIRYLKKHQ